MYKKVREEKIFFFVLVACDFVCAYHIWLSVNLYANLLFCDLLEFFSGVWLIKFFSEVARVCYFAYFVEFQVCIIYKLK
jgi:hypothetical protein